MRRIGFLVPFAALLVAAACTGGGGGGSPTPTPTPTPTLGGLHVSWTLRGAVSGSALTCTQAGAATIDVTSTSSTNGSNVIDNPFPCTLGTSDALGFAFGTWNSAIQAIDAGGLGLGPATVSNTVLGPSPCDAYTSGQCVHDLPVVVQIDGL